MRHNGRERRERRER
jgi:hypothetical protein